MLGLDQQLAVPGPPFLAVGVEPGFLPLIQTPQGFPQRIYFTVSHATRLLVPTGSPGWWTATQRSGATILCTSRFTPTAPWSQPQVFLSYADLGLAQNEDIDPLAYDAANNRILFSVVGNAHDQFLTVDLCDDGPPVPTTVVKTDGTPVSQSVGTAQNDEVDAVCTLDPQRPTGGPPALDDFGNSVGAPRPGLLGVPTISGSAFRRYQGGQVFFDTFMVGWPPTAGEAPGFAAAFLTTFNNLDPVLIGGIHVRNTANVQPGDPQTESVLLPPALRLTSTPVTFRWFALDFATAELAEAWPVQVYL
jgi:hypothetical protein